MEAERRARLGGLSYRRSPAGPTLSVPRPIGRRFHELISRRSPFIYQTCVGLPNHSSKVGDSQALDDGVGRYLGIGTRVEAISALKRCCKCGQLVTAVNHRGEGSCSAFRQRCCSSPRCRAEKKSKNLSFPQLSTIAGGGTCIDCESLGTRPNTRHGYSTFVPG